MYTCRGNTRVGDVINLWEYVLTLLEPMEEQQLISDKLSVVDFISPKVTPRHSVNEGVNSSAGVRRLPSAVHWFGRLDDSFSPRRLRSDPKSLMWDLW